MRELDRSPDEQREHSVRLRLGVVSQRVQALRERVVAVLRLPREDLRDRLKDVRERELVPKRPRISDNCTGLD